MENRMMGKGLEGWNMKEQEEDILDRKEVEVEVRMQQMKKSPSKMVVVEVVRRGACQVHSLQREVGECARQSDHHDSHNHHNNHQTHSRKDQGKVGHTLDEGEVCETYHGRLVLLGVVVVGHPVVDHRNHDRVVLRLLVCRDLCHGMSHHRQDVLNDHLYPWSNEQNELEEVEHDSRV
jgi:hypothetical protein